MNLISQLQQRRRYGIKDDSYDELSREQSQLKKVDIVLGDHETNYQRRYNYNFSDNGSQSQPKTIDGPFEFIEGSSGTIEKIWSQH